MATVVVVVAAVVVESVVARQRAVQFLVTVCYVCVM